MDQILTAQHAITDRLIQGDAAQLLRGSLPQAQLTFKAMTSKRWRRSALSDYSSQDIYSKIRLALEEERELTFSIPFGGYKGWRISSSPLPNWAEVFFVDYLRRFIREVSAAFPYGVRAELTYVSGVMDLVSNYNSDWQQAYVDAMAHLLSYYSDEPGQISIVDIATLPGVGDVRSKLLRNYHHIRGEWVSGNLNDGQAKKLLSAKRNFAVRGLTDFIDVDKNELEERILNSAILCDALDSLVDRRNYNKFGPRIQLVFGKDPQPALHIGSCETSTVHFWVSEGVLESHKERVLPRLIGHSSLKTIESGSHNIEVVSLESHRAQIGQWLPATCRLF